MCRVTSRARMFMCTFGSCCVTEILIMVLFGRILVLWGGRWRIWIVRACGVRVFVLSAQIPPVLALILKPAVRVCRVRF